MSRIGMGQLFALLAMVPLSLACGDRSVIPTVQPDREDLYWSLDLDHHAVTLSTAAPYDKLQLVGTPLNFADEPLAGLPAPQFRSTDADRVAVTEDGLLIAAGRTSQPVLVLATLTYGNLTYSDSVFVTVVDNQALPVPASFSIHPLPPDSAKIGAFSTEGYSGQPPDTLLARAIDGSGARIPVYPHDSSASILPVYFRSADTTVVRVSRTDGIVFGERVGTTSIYASTTAFGVMKADTLMYRVGWPVIQMIRLFAPMEPGGPLFTPQTDIRIGTGGVVAWSIVSRLDPADTVDVVFADADLSNIRPVAPVIDLVKTFGEFATLWMCNIPCDVGGNISINAFDGFSTGRHFPIVGTYEYHGGRKSAGVSGRVTVVDER